MKLKSCLFILSLSLFTLALASGCTGSNQPSAEQPLTASNPSSQPSPVNATPTTAPTLPDVEQAVNRVFKNAAVIHPNYKNTFLTGDFNGDLSQDLAVVLKPVTEKLAEMNEEYPRWLLRDPRAPHNRRAPLRVEKNEPLLAVIHGHGANAWRDPEATQTFLLKNVAGADMRVHKGKEFIKTNTGRKLPRANGDLIGEKLKGSEGYLYFNAATYSWYDPKTFKSEADTTPGVFHGRNARR